MQWNTLQVSLFYSFHLRKSKFYRYLAFADLSNIFLIQSLSWSLLHFQRSPITRHRRFTYGFVNYITPFPRNVSLCLLWGEGYIFGPSHKLGVRFKKGTPLGRYNFLKYAWVGWKKSPPTLDLANLAVVLASWVWMIWCIFLVVRIQRSGWILLRVLTSEVTNGMKKLRNLCQCQGMVPGPKHVCWKC